MLLTVKEPPRGYSDPPSAGSSRAGLRETLKELSTKTTFWTMAAGASLVALVGYGLVGFQAPLAQRLHGVDPGTFAIQFGGPLAIMAALGTVSAGIIIDRLSTRMSRAVAIVPAIGLLLSTPLYFYAYSLPTEDLYSVSRPVWCLAVYLHYMYLGSQYTIGQGVVRQRSRASAIAILLLLIGLIGNSLGAQVVGWLSDFFMGAQLDQANFGNLLSSDLCRNAAALAKLPIDQQAVCRSAYAEGLRSAMMTVTLLFIPGSLCFYWSSRTLKRDMVA
jgi:hypothetical protein